MELSEVRELKKAARKAINDVPVIGPMMMDELTSAVTLGVGWRPEGEGYRLTARIRTEVPNPLAEQRIRLALHSVVGSADFDLRYTGPVFPLQAGGPLAQPGGSQLRVGSAVRHNATVRGTLGFFAKSRGADGTRGFVSANHVIADLGRHHDDNSILGPSESRVGQLVRFTNLGGGGEKRTDAAFARLDPSVPVNRSSLPQGKTLTSAVVAPQETRHVMKVGVATNFREGNITSFDQDTFRTRYAGFGRVNFDDQIEVEAADGAEAFAAPGDSGSLVYNDEGHAVGLLFAATVAGLAYINPIRFVLDDLGVDIDVLP